MFCCVVQIDLSDNSLTNWGLDMSGVKAFADAIGVSHSLSSINLRSNNIGSEGAKVLAPAIRDSHSLTQVLAIRKCWS